MQFRGAVDEKVMNKDVLGHKKKERKKREPLIYWGFLYYYVLLLSKW